MSLLGLRHAASGPRLVWLHGFTQTKDSGHVFRTILAGSFEVLTLDLPGHGENSTVSATLEETADLLAAVLPTESFTLGGYSMGARVALHFALAHLGRLNGLVLVSGTLGISDETDRAARRVSDEVLANRIEEIGTETFLDEWLSRPMFSSLPSDPRERNARSHDAAGLANSLRLSGTGQQRFLAPEVQRVNVPTLVVAGSRDVKFSKEARLLAEVLPNSRLASLDAGHALPLEQPEALATLISSTYRQ